MRFGQSKHARAGTTLYFIAVRVMCFLWSMLTGVDFKCVPFQLSATSITIEQVIWLCISIVVDVVIWVSICIYHVPQYFGNTVYSSHSLPSTSGIKQFASSVRHGSLRAELSVVSEVGTMFAASEPSSAAHYPAYLLQLRMRSPYYFEISLTFVVTTFTVDLLDGTRTGSE